MKCLIVEDDFVARTLLQKFLSDVSECHIAARGQEAMRAFTAALDEGDPYDLICLDIMMPEMDGHQVLQAVRQLEDERGIHGLDGVKVIVTTALGDSKNIMGAFSKGCEAYLVKPLSKAKLFKEMDQLGLSVNMV
jgi:two-component system chemotaxis response regulator CheY